MSLRDHFAVLDVLPHDEARTFRAQHLGFAKFHHSVARDRSVPRHEDDSGDERGEPACPQDQRRPAPGARPDGAGQRDGKSPDGQRHPGARRAHRQEHAPTPERHARPQQLTSDHRDLPEPAGRPVNSRDSFLCARLATKDARAFPPSNSQFRARCIHERPRVAGDSAC